MLSMDPPIASTTSGRGAAVVRISVAQLITSTELPSPADGATVAAHVVAELQLGVAGIDLDFTGVTGLTTSFATMLFRGLFATVDPDVVRSKVKFTFGSGLQRDVLRRSLNAARVS